MAIPTITSNILSIEEGNTRTLSLNNLNAIAEGAANEEILITIVPDSETSLAGEFLVSGAPSLTFTLADVESNLVVFDHDGSNFAPSYSVIASNNGDQSPAQPAQVIFDAVNDAPVVEANVLTISEGGTVVLNQDGVNLLTTDEPGESPPEELTYDIRSVTNGKFQKLVDGVFVDLGVSDDAFTQADVNNGLIQFVHDGSELAPTYRLRVVDGGLPGDDFDSLPIGQSTTGNITFLPENDAPEITKNQISLTEGDTIAITTANLAAKDVEEDDATLTFTISAIAGGRFELLDAPGGSVAQVLAAPGAESVGFTQAQIAAGLIQFVNDPATDAVPSYTVDVSDSGQLTATAAPDPALVETASSEAIVDFTAVNDTPIVVVPDAENPTLLDLEEESQVTLTAANLEVIDEESEAANLTYTVTDLDSEPAGQFIKLSTDGGAPTPVTTFTQADINEALIAFDYFGVKEAPSFSLKVTDEGGEFVEIASDEIFNFISINDEPLIDKAELALVEGETVALTQDNLLVTDEETEAAGLEYTVTINQPDPENPLPPELSDKFIVDGAVEVGPTVTFTQQQVNDGLVSYVHGGSNFAPDLTVTVTDTAVGGAANTIDVPFNVIFEAINDLPELNTLALTLTEGDTVPITTEVLSVVDEESGPEGITYTVGEVTGGQFLRLPTDPEGEAIVAETFTQAEVDAGNVIVFEHDGLNDAPTFSLTASDGEDEITITDESGQGVDFTPTNDAPVVEVSAFTAPEGDPDNPMPITLTAAELSTTDEESSPEELTYTVTLADNDPDNPDVFQIDGVIEVGPEVSFTQAQVNAGLVKFIPGGANTLATLTATVTDTFPAEFGDPITVDVPLTIDFIAENDVPVVEKNSLTISEGGTVIFSSETNLRTTDEETPPEELVYTIQSVMNGKFERIDLGLGTSTEIPVEQTFTQAEVNAGEIQFVHDGGEEAPTYELVVTDTPLDSEGMANEVPITGNIVKFSNVNDDPTFDANTLTIMEGGEVTFSAANIAASDPDNLPSELRFNITNVTGGTFTFKGQPLVEGTNFTAADITFGDLSFVDDGDETPPTYDVTVLDPVGGNTTAAAEVLFEPVNDPPIITANDFTIAEDGQLVLNNPDTGVINLAATDDETLASELVFILSNVQGGTFFDFNAQPITEFTQATLNLGEIRFLQDGSSLTPSFDITVKDGDNAEVTEAANVDFIQVNDPPVVQVSAFDVIEGETVTLSEATLLTEDDPGESGPEDLTYTVAIADNDPDQPDGFEIDGVLQTGPEVTFTQAQVNAGLVKFVQGGSNTLATLTATVTDAGVGEPITVDVPLTVGFTATNDPLVVENKNLSISEGGTVILTEDNLLTTDEETPPEDLEYTVISTTNGTFQRLDTDLGTAADIAIEGTFTQAEVSAGEIQFVHNGAEEPPAFSLKVEDTPLVPEGETTSETFDGIIDEFTNVNDDPIFDFNTLTVEEGGEVVFTADNLAASDPDNLPSQLRFSIAEVAGGEFFLDGALLAPGQSFSAAAIAFGELSFKDDGDEIAPTYTVTVRDNVGGNTTEAATIVFEPVNDPPTITENTFTITEGKRLTLNNPDTGVINLTATDPETAAADLLFQVSNVTGGQFFDFNAQPVTEFTQSVLDLGEISFKQDGTETVPTFDITVLDGEGGEVTAPGNVTFVPVNDPPAIENAQLTVTEGEAITIALADISADDPDTPPEGLTFTVSELDGGTFNIVVDGAVTEADVTSFTQAQITAGQVQFVDDGDQVPPSFSVSVSDGEFDSETVPVTILEFINVNDPPVAVPDSGIGFTTDENTAFTTASVLTNDTDEDPGDVDNLFVSQIEGQDVAVGNIELASGAIVSFIGDGTISYDPNGKFQLAAGVSADDSFTYTVSDGNGGTDSTTVTVTVTGVNDAPIAVDDKGEGFSTLDNESFTTPPLTDNDVDEDGDPLRIIKLNDATVNPGDTVALDETDNATATLNEDGSITYTPSDVFKFLAVGQTAEDTFTYTITDDKGGESQATVTILINGANEAPVAADDVEPGFSTVEGLPITLDVLANDTDIDVKDTLAIASVDTTGLIGSVVNNGSSLTYVPSQVLRGGETATETFTYTVSDGNGGTDTAAVKVVVTGINDAPVAVADSGAGFVTNEALTFTTANVLANDSDPEGGPLSLVGLNTSGTRGLVTNNGNGTFTYDPNGAFNTLPQGKAATDTFSYTIADDVGVTATATVSITVNGLLSSFFDFEQFLQLQNPSATAPGNTVDVLPLAQLYDESFYLSRNPDVAAVVGSVFNTGFDHFVTAGQFEGRNPSILFNEAFYRNQNPDVAAAIQNGAISSGLQHFLTSGHREGRDPSVFFDQSDYLLSNPDVAQAVSTGGLASAFQHYILAGVDEQRMPILGLFNDQFYLANNPDVAAAGFDPYTHFVIAGQFEGRRPSALYSESSYLTLNPDVKAAVDADILPNGFQHFQAIGRFEGRNVFA